MLKVWITQIGNHAEAHIYRAKPFAVLVIVVGMTIEQVSSRSKAWAIERGYEIEQNGD